MNQELYEWLLIIGRWIHITVAVTWIGESIFFMWLDRSFVRNEKATAPGHVGEVWMVHGGGFYHVEKLLLGPTKVPKHLHWFKWESYATWMSGMFLMTMIFYTGDGTYLLDETVSSLSYGSAVVLAILSIVGSWFFYDFLWELEYTREKPLVGHALTIFWFIGMTYVLCHTLSGRAAYLHVGAMLGTWMTANVFMRIIPRQLKMVEASKKGEPVNQEWGKNAKNRSTHNTYFTLPVIFIMLSNHFPSTYGHDYNWIILILLAAVGAAVREFFVVREKNIGRGLFFLGAAVVLFGGVLGVTHIEMPKDIFHLDLNPQKQKVAPIKIKKTTVDKKIERKDINQVKTITLKGKINFIGNIPKGKKLKMPTACAKQFDGEVLSKEVVVENSGLNNVLVRVLEGQERYYGYKSKTNVSQVDQKGCLYSPKVTAVMVGQPVEFINSDPVFHNVKARTKQNGSFNINMPKQNQKETRVFENPEFLVKTKCSLHPWMGSYIAVLDHPFFSVSKNGGTFSIENLPRGKFVIEAWHEVYGSQATEIDTTQVRELTFNFGGRQ